MLLKVRFTSSFQTEIHHHGSQKLKSKIRKISPFIFEDFKNHRNDTQADHLSSGLLGERKTLQNANDWFEAFAFLAFRAEEAY